MSKLDTLQEALAAQLGERVKTLDRALGEITLIEEGGTTVDGAFTVQKAECLGACADAPVLLVNDRQMVSFMNDVRIDELVSSLRAPTAADPA